MLPTALVYLAEAAWQLGDEDEADRLTREAYSVARTNGDLGRLLLALADFPGVLSRALDLESEPDGTWHALGRAVVRAPSTTRSARHGHGARARVRRAGPRRRRRRRPAEDPEEPRSRLVPSLEQERHRAPRPSILTALWNGRDDEPTRAYLRQAVKHLREALPEGACSRDRGGHALPRRRLHVRDGRSSRRSALPPPERRPGPQSAPVRRARDRAARSLLRRVAQRRLGRRAPSPDRGVAS